MTIIRLDNLCDSRLKPYTSLTNHQLRNALDPKHGIVIVESQIAIRVAMNQGVRPLSFLFDERRLETMGDVIQSVDKDVPVFVLPPEIAKELTGYAVTRGALCAARRPTLPGMRELIASSQRVVVLEGITDTSNVGAAFRNAAAMGADAVVVAPTCADPLSRRAVRVSMGNVFKVPWTRAEGTWPDALFLTLRELEFTSVALALTDDALDLRAVRKMDLGRIALLFGSEGAGLSAKVLDHCDYTAIIPMQCGVDSLNVAASSAVAMWELFA